MALIGDFPPRDYLSRYIEAQKDGHRPGQGGVPECLFCGRRGRGMEVLRVRDHTTHHERCNCYFRGHYACKNWLGCAERVRRMARPD